MEVKLKIVQVGSSGNDIVVLCSDGSLWMRTQSFGKYHWIEIPPPTKDVEEQPQGKVKIPSAFADDLL